MSITKTYLLLSLNEKGSFLTLKYSNQMIGLLVSGLIELSSQGVIRIQKNDIAITERLPESLNYLAPIYDYLANEPRATLEKTMNNFLLTFPLTNGELFDEVGQSLAKDNLVTIQQKSGLVAKKRFIPRMKEKEKVIESLKQLFDSELASELDYALLEILKQTDQLSNLHLERYADLKMDSNSGVITKKMIEDLEAVLTVCCIV